MSSTTLRVTAAGSQVQVARLLSAAATTNAALVKGSTAKLLKVGGFTAAAAPKYLKLYNKATAPTVGTDTPVLTFVLPVGAWEFDVTEYGVLFPLGLGYAITGAIADADTTALTAADVTGLRLLYA